MKKQVFIFIYMLNVYQLHPDGHMDILIQEEALQCPQVLRGGHLRMSLKVQSKHKPLDGP